MIRRTILTAIIVCCAWLPAVAGDTVTPAAKVRQFNIRENDSTTYILNLALDDAGRPLYYFRNIFTPVCYTGECKPVYINFYWDLLGNYERFDLPGKEVLTKLDHREFKKADYEKLQEILAKPNSILADLKMEDLIVPGTENLTDSVDARTGATLKTIKNEVIEGAVYTCYTLWHLAYGQVTDEILKITETYNDNQLLHNFLSGDNHHYQYWAMERVMDKQGNVTSGFEADIRKIISGKNIFIARYALQKVNNSFLQDNAAQEWLWHTYGDAAYPLQLTVLKKLANISISNKLAERVSTNLSGANPEQFRLLLAVLAAQKILSAKVTEKMAAYLENGDTTYAGEIYRVLKQRPVNHAIKKKLSDYEHKNNQTTD
ncbi:hypothetical protein [Chitinophaga sp. MM2321]|uniref:hypothetical protein n=1 Tax=Chitinophaga sp. MM2321 TaxID=3137178 RepID=UPI0032D570A6